MTKTLDDDYVADTTTTSVLDHHHSCAAGKTTTTLPSRLLPSPHSWWWHPNKSLADIVCTALIGKWVLKLDQMADDEKASTTGAACEHLANIRAMHSSKMALSAARKQVRAWSKHNDDGPIAEIVHGLPRPSVQSVVREWGLNGTTNASTNNGDNIGGDDDDSSMEQLLSKARYPPASSPIPVHFFFPASLVSSSLEKTTMTTTTTDRGFLRVSSSGGDDDDENDETPLLSELFRVINQEKTPVVVHVHGGGMVFGAAYANPVGWITDMYVAAKNTTTEKASTTTTPSPHRPLVCVSIDYSLSPEYTFPTAPVEVLTAISYLFRHVSELHLMGESAGANLAAVATMECIRRYHHSSERDDASSVQNKCTRRRIASSLIMWPFLNPAADSESYYMNSQEPFVPPKWLRWCWRCYLQLSADDPPPSSCAEEHDKQQQEQEKTITARERTLAKNSNRTAWNRSQWKGTFWERLINPSVDLPHGRSLSSNSANASDATIAPILLPPAPPPRPTEIIVVTNAGDPLCDDGAELVRKLRKNNNSTDDADAQGEEQRCCYYNVTHLQHRGSHGLGTQLFGGKDKEDMLQLWYRTIFASSSGAER